MRAIAIAVVVASIGFDRPPFPDDQITRGPFHDPSHPSAFRDSEETEAFRAPLTSDLTDLYGSTPTCTDTGPICAWSSLTEITCYADNTCPVGTVIPPGLTGAGSGGGLLAVASYTNQILQSEDLTTSWSASGTGTVTCAQAESPYADGRTTCMVEDDDGSGAEYVSQVHAWADAATSSTFEVCVAAQSDSLGSVDLQVVEATSCTGSTVNYSALAVTDSWQMRCWTHTVADGACTDFTVRLSPTDDITDTSATGAVRMTAVSLVRSVTSGLPIHCPTTTSAVTCGDVTVSYGVTAPSSRGRCVLDYVPGRQQLGAQFLLSTRAGAAGWEIYHFGASGALQWFSHDGTGFAIKASSESLTWTQGETYTVDTRWVPGETHWRRDGTTVAGVSGTRTAAPTNVLFPGYQTGGSAQPDGWISNVRCWR